MNQNKKKKEEEKADGDLLLRSHLLRQSCWTGSDFWSHSRATDDRVLPFCSLLYFKVDQSDASLKEEIFQIDCNVLVQVAAVGTGITTRPPSGVELQNPPEGQILSDVDTSIRNYFYIKTGYICVEVSTRWAAPCPCSKITCCINKFKLVSSFVSLAHC